MEKLLQKIFSMYLNEDYYEREIMKDVEYIALSKKLINFDNIFINELSSTYMELCEVYRK